MADEILSNLRTVFENCQIKIYVFIGTIFTGMKWVEYFLDPGIVSYGQPGNLPCFSGFARKLEIRKLRISSFLAKPCFSNAYTP